MDYCKANPKKYLIWNARSRAKKMGLEFEINEDDFDIPVICPILKIKLTDVRMGHKNKEFSPSLDRIDTSKGYIRGNICIISHKANRLKSDMSTEDIKNMYEYVISAGT